MNVRIFPYVAEKGVKCSVHISNFYNAQPSEDDFEIEKKAQAKV